MSSNRYARGLAPRRDIPPPRRTYRPPRYSPTPVRPPLPSNDNHPGARRLPPGLSRQARRSLLRRIGLRAVPILGWALTAYEVGRLIRGFMNPEPVAIAPAGRLTPLGYTLTEDCGTPNGNEYGWMDVTRSCGSVTNPSNVPLGNNPVDWGVSLRAYYWKHPLPTDPGYHPDFPRVGRKERWDRNPVGPYAPPGFVPIPDYWPLPGVVPRPFQPMPEPLPEPVRRPRPRPRPQDDPNVLRDPVPSPVPAPRSWPRPRPARRGERERKVAGSAGLRRWLGWILSTYSEVGDFIDALYDALPDNVQSRGDRNLAQKFQRIYDNIDKLDLNEAMTNLIENQVTDPKYAEAFNEVQEVFEEFGFDLPDLRGIGNPTGR